MHNYIPKNEECKIYKKSSKRCVVTEKFIKITKGSKIGTVKNKVDDVL